MEEILSRLYLSLTAMPKVALDRLPSMAAQLSANGPSRISTQAEGLPRGASGNVRRTEGRVWVRLYGLARLKVPTGTRWTHGRTRKSIPTMFFFFLPCWRSEDQCGRHKSWGWCFSRKAGEDPVADPFVFEKCCYRMRLPMDGWIAASTAPFVHHYRDGIPSQWRFYRCDSRMESTSAKAGA